VTPMKRRTFLKGSATASVLAVAAAAGLLRPQTVLAAAWPQAAFDAKDMNAVTQALYGAADAPANSAIQIKAPIQAENGAVVPIAVSTSLDRVEGIAIMVDKNAAPLIGSVSLSGAGAGYFSARMKMGKTSDVKVVVKAGGKLYSATQNIKVTVGGCGG